VLRKALDEAPKLLPKPIQAILQPCKITTPFGGILIVGKLFIGRGAKLFTAQNAFARSDLRLSAREKVADRRH
jgi:hypothetical protein